MGLVNQRGEDAMQPEELYDDGLDFDDEEAFEAEDWDEETLGLDWNDADTQSLVDEVIPQRGWAD